MRKRIIVVGAGVIGLSCAHELAADGHSVTIVADVDTPDTVSAVAAALWFPYRSERSAAANVLLRRSLDRFRMLVDTAEAGVALRHGTVVERRPDADRSWLSVLSDYELTPPERLPPGATAGVDVVVPVIHIPTYLAWLRQRVIDAGVQIERRRVTDLAELAEEADLAVVAGGVRGGGLLGGDPSMAPIRGQVVRLKNPGLTDWITDDENPGGVTYVIPRGDDVVVGGTAVEGSWDTAVHRDVEDAILDRATRLVPELRSQEIVGRAAGLRPARPAVRIERVLGTALPTIAAYGHGGGGVTLSWGTAELVSELASAVDPGA